ncbi:MAG TPA: DinB family protein [Caldilineae bacterium]|nr:DinB family protein [Caldilineae bacterium]
MLDFGPVRRREIRLADYARQQNVSREDLIAYSNEMIDALLALLDGLEDADIVFVPYDPDAEDPYAETEEEMHIGWTIGHIIAHTTASSEECCAHSAELARGVKVCGRSRYETPWEQIQTVGDTRQRLEESRRMRLAYLDAWPDNPNLELTYTPYKSPQNCVVRVLAGLFHEEGHFDQIREVKRQAAFARG